MQKKKFFFWEGLNLIDLPFRESEYYLEIMYVWILGKFFRIQKIREKEQRVRGVWRGFCSFNDRDDLSGTCQEAVGGHKLACIKGEIKGKKTTSDGQDVFRFFFFFFFIFFLVGGGGGYFNSRSPSIVKSINELKGKLFFFCLNKL